MPGFPITSGLFQAGEEEKLKLLLFVHWGPNLDLEGVCLGFHYQHGTDNMFDRSHGPREGPGENVPVLNRPWRKDLGPGSNPVRQFERICVLKRLGECSLK